MFKDKRQFIEYVAILCLAILITAWLVMDRASLLAAFNKFLGVLSPFFIGFGIAYILNQPISKLEKRLTINRNYIILGTYLALLLILAIFSVNLAPKIYDSASRLINDIGKWGEQIPSLLYSYDFGAYDSLIYDNLSKAAEFLSKFSNLMLTNIVEGIVGFAMVFFNIILGIIISIYMLMDKASLKSNMTQLIHAFVPKEKTASLFEFLSDANSVFSHFLTGLIVEAIIIGILAFIGLSLLGVKYALVLGFIICLTNVIPYFGPFIGAVPAILTTLMYDPVKAVWVAIFIVVLQQIDGSVVGPKVMGNYIGLKPIWIILSISIGGGFGGLLGILLAIPLGAIAKILIVNTLEKKQQKNEAKTSATT